jgi:cold shock CspA family protein
LPPPQDLLVTTWDGAYHWHTDKTISAVDAIKLRENGRKESGDYWCHKSCHSRQPRDGIELYPRNHPITPHFWKGSGNFTKINDCEFNQLQIERKESTRYSQFYHDLRSWLDTDEAKQKLGFSTFSENKARKYSDFILVATASKDVKWTEMEIIVVHKNRKRVPQTNNYIRIDLSQWTIKQILNFEEYGKRKVIEEFEKIAREYEISRCEKEYGFAIPDDVLRGINFEKIKDAFKDEEQRMNHQAVIEEAIDRNVEKYGKRGQQKKFSSPSEVDRYYERMFGEEFAQRQHEEHEQKIQWKKIERKQQDFEKIEGVSLVGTFHTIEELNAAIKNYQQFRDLIDEEIENVNAHFESYKENKDSYSPKQKLFELKQIEAEIQEISHKIHNFNGARGLEYKGFQDFWSEIFQLRSSEETKLTSEYQEYEQWFLDYRKAVAKFFIRNTSLSVTKKDREKLKSLAEYWINLDFESLVAQLIVKKVLQYDTFTTMEDLLKVPIMEKLTPGIDLCEIVEKSDKRRIIENERIANTVNEFGTSRIIQKQEKQRDKKRGREKIGNVTRWIEEKGYGFVTCDGSRYFLHITKLEYKHTTPRVGHTVVFNVEKTAKGYSAVDALII